MARSAISVKAAIRAQIVRVASKVWKTAVVALPGTAPPEMEEEIRGSVLVREGAEAGEGAASVSTASGLIESNSENTDVKSSAHFSKTSSVHRLLSLAMAVVLVLLSGCSAQAQQGNEKTFSSPGDAVVALYNAVKSNDMQTLNAIFGSNAGPILRSGDDVADKNMAVNFIAKYDQMHRVVMEQEQTVTLYIGAENWPMPIPLVNNSAGGWYFDTETGKKEILYRRVGTNENDAIEILHALVAAQHEYASTLHDSDNANHYAAKFLSDEGKRDGLYWKNNEDERPSPIGPLLVSAASEGYTTKEGKQTPFHGYYYRILTKQGPAAKGGARDYRMNGELVRGFAFVAYPAEYRNSGVMTFIVGEEGVVYQKDLGEDTMQQATAMSQYNPDKTWIVAE